MSQFVIMEIFIVFMKVKKKLLISLEIGQKNIFKIFSSMNQKLKFQSNKNQMMESSILKILIFKAK